MKNIVWTEKSSKINKTWQEIIYITEKINCQEIIDTMANLSHIPNKRTGKNVYCAISCLEEIHRFKKNITVMCWQNYQKDKDLFIYAMEILKIRREFIVYKHCIRHKTTGGKIFFKIINNGNCAKIEFKRKNKC